MIHPNESFLEFAIVPQITIDVDIAKDKFDVTRLCERKYRHKKFDNNPQGFTA